MNAQLVYRPMRKPTCKLLLFTSLYWGFLELIGFIVLLVSYIGIPNPTYEQQSFFMNNLIILAALSVPAVIAFLAAVLNWKSSIEMRQGSGNSGKGDSKHKKRSEKSDVESTLDSLELKD